jgi:hypothetical protein
MLRTFAFSWFCMTSACWLQLSWCPSYITPGRTQQKTPPSTILLCWHGRLPSDRLDIISAETCLSTVARNGRLFIHPWHSNGCTRCTFRGLCSATGLYATIFIKKWFLFTVRSVCRVKRFTSGSRNSLKDVQKSQIALLNYHSSVNFVVVLMLSD